ncbi:hypothetical protein KM043_015805 [Ampulex compressa]|nr:hypothetical protein KM043_015805 [Ampulex compressa]
MKGDGTEFRKCIWTRVFLMSLKYDDYELSAKGVPPAQQAPRNIHDLFFHPPRLQKTKRGPKAQLSNFLEEPNEASAKMGMCFGKADDIPRNPAVDVAPLKENQGLIVFLIGGPGAGKTTLAKKLAGKYGLFLVSASDLLREEVRAGTERGQRFEEIMKKGCNVPADVIVQMVEEKMITQPNASGYLLVGFPRDKKQAVMFNKEVRRPTLVLNLSARRAILEERMKNRATQAERFDDTAEIACNRIKSYFSTVSGAVAPNKKLTTVIDAEKEEEEVFQAACSAVDEAKEQLSKTESQL